MARASPFARSIALSVSAGRWWPSAMKVAVSRSSASCAQMKFGWRGKSGGDAVAEMRREPRAGLRGAADLLGRGIGVADRHVHAAGGELADEVGSARQCGDSVTMPTRPPAASCQRRTRRGRAAGRRRRDGRRAARPPARRTGPRRARRGSCAPPRGRPARASAIARKTATIASSAAVTSVGRKVVTSEPQQRPGKGRHASPARPSVVEVDAGVAVDLQVDQAGGKIGVVAVVGITDRGDRRRPRSRRRCRRRLPGPPDDGPRAHRPRTRSRKRRRKRAFASSPPGALPLRHTGGSMPRSTSFATVRMTRQLSAKALAKVETAAIALAHAR